MGASMGLVPTGYVWRIFSALLIAAVPSISISQQATWPESGSTKNANSFRQGSSQPVLRTGWGHGSDANDGPSPVPPSQGGGVKWPQKTVWPPGTVWPQKKSPQQSIWPSNTQQPSGGPSSPGSGLRPSPAGGSGAGRVSIVPNSTPKTVHVAPPALPKNALPKPSFIPAKPNPLPRSDSSNYGFGFGLADAYGDYGRGPAFGVPDDSLPAEDDDYSDIDVTDTPGFYPSQVKSTEQPPPSTSNTPKQEYDPFPKTEDLFPPHDDLPSVAESKPATSTDKLEELGKVAKDPRDGEPLGNPAKESVEPDAKILDDEIISGTVPKSEWPTSNQSGGGKSTVQWPSEGSSGTNNVFPKKEETPTSINPWDSKRPGIQGGDFSIEAPFSGFIDNQYIDPKTGQVKDKTTGVAIDYHLPWDKQRKDLPKPREATQGDRKYFDALDRAANAAAANPGNPQTQAGTGVGKLMENPTPQSQFNTTASDQSVNNNKPQSRDLPKSNVTITPGSGFPERMIPDSLIRKAESGLNTVIDGMNSLIPDGLRRDPPPAVPDTPLPLPAPVDFESQPPTRPVKTPQEKQEFKAKQEVQRLEDERRWQLEEGEAFTKRFGPRPSDTNEAAAWDKKQQDRLRTWKFWKDDQEMNPPATTPDGIRN